MSDETRKPTEYKLYRSEKDRVIAGVAGGIGQYLGVDSVVIRTLFAITAFLGGGGVVFYLLMWVLVPTKANASKENSDNIKSSIEEMKDFSKNIFESKSESNNKRLGLILIIVGGYFLAQNFGLLDWLDIGQLWPLGLILIGILAIRK